MESKDYLVKEVEIDLQKYWLVLKRRWLPAVSVFGGVTALAAGFAVLKQPIFQAEGTLLFKANPTPSLVGIEAGQGELKALTSRDDPLDTQVEIFRSIPVAQAVIETLNLKNDQDELLKPKGLLEPLTVKGIAGTDVLQVAFHSTDPELATTIVNTIMDVYIQKDIQTNRAEAAAARDFILEQLPETEAAVNKAEEALRQFKEQNGVIDLQEEASNAVETLSDLDDTIIQLEAQLVEVDARSAELQQQLRMNSEQAYAIGVLSESPGVQAVLSELQQVQAQLTVERTRYEADHPAIANLRRQVDALNDLLQTRIWDVLRADQNLPEDDLQTGALERSLISEFVRLEAERSGLTERIALLSDAEAAQVDRASVLPGLEKTERELQRQLVAAQTTFETLLTQLQEVQVLEHQNVGNARIVSPALMPEAPVAPAKKLYVAGGGFVGILLAISTAFLLDLLDRSVKTLKEGKELLGYPLIGVIPAWKKLTKPTSNQEEPEIPQVVVRDQPNSLMQESYQMLQSNLKFSRLDEALKIIVVTSSIAGEGKSEVSANLAFTLAQLGLKVLLVDANMRRPVQHHIWGLNNFKGLSNVLASYVSTREALQAAEPNLHILSVGLIPPNPVALLESKRMAMLIKKAATSYDFVIIDTPPIMNSADALILGRLADGLLLVMQPGLVDVNSIAEVKERLTQSQQTVLGIVANGVADVRRRDSYPPPNRENLVEANNPSWNSNEPEFENVEIHS